MSKLPKCKSDLIAAQPFSLIL